MTIQDLKCILTIAEEGSINRASKKLFIAQPSLSKCVKKVENEYGISIFQWSAGSTIRITDEGDCFLRMAQEVLQRHQLFENQLRWMRDQQDDKIILGMTPRKSYSVASPLLQWLLQNYPRYFITLQVESTAEMKTGLQDGRLNMALCDIMEQEEDLGLYYEPIRATMTWIYLRKGSQAEGKAVHLEGIEWPVLRMKDLKGEVLAVNAAGSSSRKKVEMLLEKNMASCKLLELSDWTNRFIMAEAGKATLLTTLQTAMECDVDKKRLYLLHPEENILSTTALACRQSFRKDPRFRAVLEGIQGCFQENRPLWYQKFLSQQMERK